MIKPYKESVAQCSAIKGHSVQYTVFIQALYRSWFYHVYELNAATDCICINLKAKFALNNSSKIFIVVQFPWLLLQRYLAMGCKFLKYIALTLTLFVGLFKLRLVAINGVMVNLNNLRQNAPLGTQ